MARDRKNDWLRQHAWRLFGAAAIGVAAVGCHRDMYDQPRLEPLESSTFFDDGQASRPLVEGVVPFGAPRADDALHTGKENGELVDELPLPLDAALLVRGQQRYNIYCANCHGRTGAGDGMIVQRGFRRPPTYHSDRMRGVPVGHFFDVMTNGFGAMPSYALQVPVQDRWAIAAYIRALQWSQYARVDDLPTELRGTPEASQP
jgi:mono/diheme cytochrome c family protein